MFCGALTKPIAWLYVLTPVIAPEKPESAEIACAVVRPPICGAPKNDDSPVGLPKKSPCSCRCALAKVATTSVKGCVSPRR